MGWQFCLVEDGSIYLDVDGLDDDELDIYRAQAIDGGFHEAVRLPEPVNSAFLDFAPYVLPDESYIMFSSNRPGGYGSIDLWVAFQNADGSWLDPINMGPDVNGEGDDAMPFVSHGGEYFFFITERSGDMGLSPYWASAQIIEALRSDSGG